MASSVGRFNVAMLMFNVGNMWSDSEPGAKFEEWWALQVHAKAPNTNVPNLGQQLEGVTGMSNRDGVSGLLQPLKGAVRGSAVAAPRPAAAR